MAIQFANGTQHEITIFNINDCVSVQGGRKLILKEGATPIQVIPSGINLNATKGNGDLPPTLVEGPSFLKGAVRFTAADALPEGNYDIIVVSNLYRSACVELGLDTSKLATVDGVVYADESGTRPCGCTGLAVG
jgi:hypothetical protein